jgi:hypothetical protein
MPEPDQQLEERWGIEKPRIGTLHEVVNVVAR